MPETMPQQEDLATSIEQWCLFHGTSAELASGILKHGSLPYLRDIGAERLAAELWRRMRLRYGDANGVVSRLQDHGCQFTMSAVLALLTLTGERPMKNFEYGDFYASFGLQRAARYALRARCGSELLGIFADVIATLKSDGEDLEQLLDGMPELSALTLQTSSPVVLEISGLSIDNLADEKGGPLDIRGAQRIWSTLQLFLSMKSISNAGTALDLRLIRVAPSHVRGVYRLDRLAPDCVASLRGIPTSDDVSLVAIQACRWSVEEFLASSDHH